MAKTKEQRVHEVFESISDRYDFMNSIISFRRHKAWRQYTMKKMNVPKGATTLDVCCGTCDWTIALADAVGQEGKVIGLDFSQNMLEVGRKKVQERQLKQIELMQGNAMKLPFENDSFDYVTIGFGLRNVPDYQHVLNELTRVTKPGGKVVCIETSQPETPGFTMLFKFYFRNVMPLLGKLFASSYEQYSWLQESADSFPGMRELAKMYEEAGLVNVKVKAFSLGVAAMHMGTKK